MLSWWLGKGAAHLIHSLSMTAKAQSMYALLTESSSRPKIYHRGAKLALYTQMYTLSLPGHSVLTQSRFDGTTVSSACPQDTGDKHRKDCSQVLQPPILQLWASSRSCLTKGSAFRIVMEQSTPESCPTFLGPSFPICHVDRPHSLTAMTRSECIPKSLSVFIDAEQSGFCLC